MFPTDNFDPAELAKFSDLAHRWWDKDSEFRPLHEINLLWLDWINALSPLKGLRVLDVGGQANRVHRLGLHPHHGGQHVALPDRKRRARQTGLDGETDMLAKYVDKLLTARIVS